MPNSDPEVNNECLGTRDISIDYISKRGIKLSHTCHAKLEIAISRIEDILDSIEAPNCGVSVVIRITERINT